jgi:hypothetical protein
VVAAGAAARVLSLADVAPAVLARMSTGRPAAATRPSLEGIGS